MILKMILGILVGAGLGAVIGHFGKCASGGCPLTATPFRGAIYGAVLGALFTFAAVGNRPAPIPEGMQPAPGEGLAYIANQETFLHYVSQPGMPCLVDFYSDHCPPCKELDPVIEKLAEKYKRRAVVCKVNTDLLPQLTHSYDINAIPTVLFFENGKEVERMVAQRPQKAYERVLDKMLESLSVPEGEE
ncbi:MAG: DUF6132 family protein [Verrucomicrobiota bacterium]